VDMVAWLVRGLVGLFVRACSKVQERIDISTWLLFCVRGNRDSDFPRRTKPFKVSLFTFQPCLSASISTLREDSLAYHVYEADTMHPTHATPIRIRGKKCPPPADTPAQQHPLERPSQPQSHRSPVEIALSARRLEKRRRTIEPQSQLELLPTEILEQIFVYNCNVGLTRASHFIGIKLSGNHVYDAFLARVFVQLEDKITKTKYLVKSFTDRLDNEARVEACTKALQARWLTWKRFTALRSRMIQQEKERLGHIYSADVSQDRVWFTAGIAKCYS